MEQEKRGRKPASELFPVGSETQTSKKERQFKPTQHVVYKLINPVGISHMYYVQKQDIHYFQDDNGQRQQKAIRYHSQATSVFLNDQKDLGDDDSRPYFENGDLVIEPENTLLIQYLDMRNDNLSNPNRKKSVQPVFYKFDPAKKAEDDMKVLETKDDAIFAYKQIAGDVEEVVAIARRIKKFNKEADFSQVKYAVRMFAVDQPEEFLKVKDDPSTKIISILEDAVDFNIIETGRQVVKWKDGEKFLDFPLGKQALEHAADWIIGGDGQTVYEEIKKKVEKLL